MLDENGFERDTAPSRWVMVAIWASVPLAALAFGLAVVAIFGIQLAAKERDVIAVGPARPRQAELAAPRAAVTVAEKREASVPRTPPQTAAWEISRPSSIEPDRDHRDAGNAANGVDRSPKTLVEATSPLRTEGEETQQADVQSPPTELPMVAARRAEAEPPLPRAPEPQASRWSMGGPALAALSVSPVPSVEARPEIGPAGRAAPVSNLPSTTGPVRGPAPEAAGLAQSGTAVAQRVFTAASVLTPSRVFIHQSANAKDGTAQTLARRLKSQGVSVAAIRAVRATPSSPEIRYFHQADRAAAMNLARQPMSPTWRVRDFLSYASPLRPGTLEIWLPNGMGVSAD